MPLPPFRRAIPALAALLPLAGVVALSTPLPAAPPDPVAVAPDPVGAAFFEKNIRALLTTNCLSCHNGTKGITKGGLALDTQDGWLKGGEHGPAIVRGKPDDSRLLQAISYTHDNLQMPPAGKLSDEQITLVRTWIARGAPDPRIAAVGTPGGEHRLSGLTKQARAHWAFQPVVEPPLPRVKDPAGWVRNPVDTFVLAYLRAHDMEPNRRAPREALMRRAYYDMIGQPPTVGEVRAFLSDRSPDAWAKVVDNLLNSPHYGERWGRHWLDSARYSDASGDKNQKLNDYRFPYAWTYRDYVINSLNDDKPYDQFLVEQIAADKLPGIKADDPRLAALGFLTVGKHFENQDDLIDERIDTVTKATMALTVSCARCHDHKFDPVPTADYYSLAGVFGSTVEPLKKPLLAGGFDVSRQADFDAKIAVLVIQNQDMFYDWESQRGSDFRKSAEGYLMAAALPGKSKERGDVIQKYGLPDDRRGEGREVFGAVRPRGTDPVLGPFFRLSRLPAGTFPTASVATIAAILKNNRAPINPAVRGMLAGLRPHSLADVAHAYATLLTGVQPLAARQIAARRAGRANAAGVTADTAELLDTPFEIPLSTELATPEAQIAFFQGMYMDNKMKNSFAFPAINELRITHAGAPGRAMVVEDAARPRDSFIHIRGDRNRLGPVAPRQFLAVVSGPDRQPFRDGSGRLELARDIASPANPLTARTLVNRVWMYHFGAGFVRTPDDLGNQSEAPSNPKLLDYLASRFVKMDWSLKSLHRMILLSNTYAESSENNPQYALRDPEDRLQWRAQVRRLDFEAIRDSLVMLTGKLDSTIGGKPVNITDEPYTYRRSIYGYVDRSNLSDLMRQFDFSDPTMPNTGRTSTIVPQQALFFMNSPMTVDVARQLVARADVAAASDDAGRVTAMYLALFQRSPRPEEIQMARDFLAGAGAVDAADGALVAPTGKARRRPQPKRRADAARNARAPIENIGLPVARTALTPWELYAQALLCSNEFVYVD